MRPNSLPTPCGLPHGVVSLESTTSSGVLRSPGPPNSHLTSFTLPLPGYWFIPPSSLLRPNTPHHLLWVVSLHPVSLKMTTTPPPPLMFPWDSWWYLQLKSALPLKRSFLLQISLPQFSFSLSRHQFFSSGSFSCKTPQSCFCTHGFHFFFLPVSSP